MKIIHSQYSTTMATTDQKTIDLLNHPAQFKVFRDAKTIATKGSLSVQISPTDDLLLIYLATRLKFAMPLEEFSAENRTFQKGSGWYYETELIE